MLNDAEFIEQFENLTLDPNEFNHLGHLRIAWLYLNENTLDLALEKITTGISAYAKSLGAADKYQHTLTSAIVYILAERRVRVSDRNFDDFIVSNKDLVDELPNLVDQYYSEDLLNSSLAKNEFLAPDIQAFSVSLSKD